MQEECLICLASPVSEGPVTVAAQTDQDLALNSELLILNCLAFLCQT
jgi:hypothetical protein